MEAFAALQSAKRRKSAEYEAAVSAKATRKRSQIDEVRLSVDLGFAAPPEQVFAAGKNQSAAVWWIYDNTDGVTSWEVHRYRRDSPGEDGWQYKGSYAFSDLSILQVNIPELTNDNEYRFTVKAVNAKGPGVESPPSNATVVESPLPQGWYRFRDTASGKYYYASVKTNRSSWKRPELDPLFLDDSIFVNFLPHELAHLQALYEEDVAHFQHVSFAQFMDALLEIGVRYSSRTIKRLFKAYAGDVHQLSTWQQYMEIMNHIKKERMEPHSYWRDFKTFFTRARAQLILRPNRDKLGLWKMEFSELASRHYYLHTQTGECSWLMPEDVKFYLPRALLDKLLRLFNMDDLEEFRQYFSLLDIDNSGDLSDKEIKLLLEAMNMPVSGSALIAMIKAIDINKNGTVEFDEFCWMMYELRRQDKGQAQQQMPAVTESKKQRRREKEEDDADEEYDDDDDISIARPNVFGSSKWQSMTLGNLRSAVVQMRSQDGTSMAPSAPSSPAISRKIMSKTTDANTLLNSMVSTKPKPQSSGCIARYLCCRTPRKQRAGYVLAVRPEDEVDAIGAGGGTGTPERRMSMSRSSKSSRATMPVLSPSGKEYGIRPEPSSPVQGQGASAKAKAKDPRKDSSLVHSPHCMCGCKAY